MKRRVPRLASDGEAEEFLDSDLSGIDFSQFKSGRLAFQNEAAKLLGDAEAALATLDDALGFAHRSLIERDSAILQLVYAFWVVYEACRGLLAEREGVKADIPDVAIREACRLRWLSAEDAEGAMAAGRDRERAVQYRPAIHDEIASRLPSHAAVLRRWLDALKERAASDT